jgi:hypothetical protein
LIGRDPVRIEDTFDHDNDNDVGVLSTISRWLPAQTLNQRAADMPRTITIEPVTRIEGHARITLQAQETRARWRTPSST